MGPTTIPTIFGTFDFPIAMVIVLLLAIGSLFYILWRSAEKREAQLQMQIKEAQERTDKLLERHIEALKDQNLVTKLLAHLLAPVKASTDLIPPMSSDQKEALSGINHIVDLVRARENQTLQNRRRGDTQR